MNYRTKEKIKSGLSYFYVILCCIILMIPFLITFFRSIIDPNGWISLDNYTKMAGIFWPKLGTSAIIAIVTVIIDVAIVLPAAFSLTRYQLKGKRIISLIMTSVWYIPGISYALALILSYYLVYKFCLNILGFIIAYSCGFLPIMLLSCIVAFRRLDPSYEEAASCLGAGRLRTFFSVTLPLIGPGVSAGILLTFVLSFNEFITAFLLSAPTAIETAPVKVFDDIQHAGMHGFIAAEASILQLISLIACLIYLKIVGTRYLKGMILI